MFSRQVEYSAEGRAFSAELLVPEGPGPWPGVLVCHEGGGLSGHTRAMAQRVTELGYVALAPDLLGETLNDRASAIARIQGLVGDPPRFRARLTGALDSLRVAPGVDPTRLAAIGFCFGGTAALELARSGVDLACVASFHGGLKTPAPAQPGAIKGAILACAGALDPFVDAAQRAAFEAEMAAAGADWELLVLGGVQHGFTNPDLTPGATPGSAYHGAADRRSWAALKALLTERFEAS